MKIATRNCCTWKCWSKSIYGCTLKIEQYSLRRSQTNHSFYCI